MRHPTQQDRARETVQRVSRTAHDILMSAGLSGPTVPHVARIAGLTQPTFNRYFAKIDELIDESLLRIVLRHPDRHGTVSLAVGLLSLQGGVGAGQTIAFTGASETLDLGGAGGFRGTIAGFGLGDKIDLADETLANILAMGSAGHVLTLPGPEATFTYAFTGSLTNETFALVQDGAGRRRHRHRARKCRARPGLHTPPPAPAIAPAISPHPSPPPPPTPRTATWCNPPPAIPSETRCSG